MKRFINICKHLKRFNILSLDKVEQYLSYLLIKPISLSKTKSLKKLEKHQTKYNY